LLLQFSQDPPDAEMKETPVFNVKPAAQEKAAGEDKPVAEDKPMAEDKPVAEDKPAAEDKGVSAAVDSQPAEAKDVGMAEAVPEPAEPAEAKEVEMVLPPVDEDLLGQLTNMDFPEIRARKALMAGSTNMDSAMEWIFSHQDEATIDDPIPLVDKAAAPASSGSSGAPGIAKSIRCVETGKLFRSTEAAQVYAEKTGRTDFEECTEEIAPLTPEEVAQKKADLMSKIAAKRAGREEDEKKQAIVSEKARREMGQQMVAAKEQLERDERKRVAYLKKKEKMDAISERKRLQDEIAKDKAERRARGGTLQGKLGVEGYAPAGSRQVDTAESAAPPPPLSELLGKKAPAPTLEPPAAMDKAVR
jgi:hypothetical protein